MFPIWYKKAEALFLEGKGYTEIGKELSVGRKTISNWLRKGGHKTDSKKLRNQKNVTKKYVMNEDLFEKIDNQFKAYWLGFLYADGYVSEFKNDIELALAEIDKEHIEKFKSFLEASNPIKKKEKKVKDKIYVSYRIIVTSSKMKKDLIEKGCFSNKSKILLFPNEKQVPKKFLNHFIRGYFDGDGSVTHANKGKQISAEILGTKDFISDLIKWTGLNQSIHSFNHSPTTYRVQFFNKKADFFFKKIYKNAEVILDRKYKKYVNFAPTKSNLSSELTKIGES